MLEGKGLKLGGELTRAKYDLVVDGKPWTGITLTALRNALLGTPGRKVRLRMQAGGERTLTFRDLV